MIVGKNIPLPVDDETRAEVMSFKLPLMAAKKVPEVFTEEVL